jgi:hypothetical protein
MNYVAFDALTDLLGLFFNPEDGSNNFFRNVV